MFVCLLITDYLSTLLLYSHFCDHKSKYSPFRVVAFNACSSLHCVLKRAQLIWIISRRWAKVSFLLASVLAQLLIAKSRMCIVGLILIKLEWVTASACFWQSPSWHVLLIWGIWRCFWNISAWSNWSRCWNQVLQTSLASAITKWIVCSSAENRFLGWVILRSRNLFKCIWLHSGFCANLWCSTPWSFTQVSLDWIIKEKRIFIEVIFGFLKRYSGCIPKLVFWILNEITVIRN